MGALGVETYSRLEKLTAGWRNLQQGGETYSRVEELTAGWRNLQEVEELTAGWKNLQQGGENGVIGNVVICSISVLFE
jgi:hypothetical protein